MIETQPQTASPAPSEPAAQWQCIVVEGFPCFPNKGRTIRIQGCAEWVSLTGMQLKFQLSWLPVEGVMLGLKGIAHSPEAKAERRPEEVEFTVRPADGPIAVVTIPYAALACVSVKVLS